MEYVYSSTNTIYNYASGIKHYMPNLYWSSTSNDNYRVDDEYVNEQLDSKDIESVIMNYKRVKTRYMANKHIIAKDDQYRKDLEQTIGYLKDLNQDISDSYIENWINSLQHRKTVISKDLNVLVQSQRQFKQFAMNGENSQETLDMNTVCSICEENKKDRVLDCGHVFCDMCLNKMEKCPICRIEIDRERIRQVYI